MNVADDGVPVPEVIEAVKRAVKAAGVSATDPGRDLRVASVGLTLHAIATRSSGGGLSFRVPFIGMEVQFGARLTTRDTHEIEISLTPPRAEGLTEIRDGGLDEVLVEAIETIRAAVASAAGGDDPFVLNDSTVTLSFAVTAEGSISIGVNGSLSDELTHTLTLVLVPASLRPGEQASYNVGGMSAVDAVVVGAGVVGLTTAISLAEAGLTTRVVAAEPPARTTSAAAGAVWGPVLCGPADRCRAWARAGLTVLSALADEPAAGVRQVSGREVSAHTASPPEWLDLLPGQRMLAPDELPPGFVSGWRYTAPVVTMPVYLEYLVRRLESLGGSIAIERVPSLTGLDAPVAVNCTGVGARSLVPDSSVVPVRGQVVVVRNPGIDEFYINHDLHGYDYVYLFPHGDLVLLGGTAEEGAWDRDPRSEVTARILRDCSAAFPALSGASVVAERVGLRPYRPSVRLEAETAPDGRVLWHNYGHGGGGVTLSWGCAREITDAVLAGAAARDLRHPAYGTGGRDGVVSWDGIELLVGSGYGMPTSRVPVSALSTASSTYGGTESFRFRHLRPGRPCPWLPAALAAVAQVGGRTGLVGDAVEHRGAPRAVG